ncbi:MAG TPA: AsmA family protein [Stellaceae bacterium]
MIKIAGGVLAGFLLAVLAIAGALAIGGGRVLAWAIENPVSRIAARQIRIDGPITIEWGEPTRIVAEDVHIANARWGSRPDLFVAQRVAIEVHPWALLEARLQIALMALDRALLLLETSREGQRNWDFVVDLLAPDGRPPLSVNRLVLRDGSVVFRDGRTAAETRFVADNLALDAPDPAGPVKLTANGTLQKQPVRLAGTAGPLGALRHPAQPYPVDLQVTLGESSIVVEGTLAQPLDFAGIDARLSVSARKPGELADALGAALPALPDLRATGELKGGHGDWALDPLTVRLGRSDVEGAIALDARGAVPYARATFTSSFIDTADLSGLVGGQPRDALMAQPSDPAGRVIPPTPVALRRLLSILPGANADVSFSGMRIAGGNGPPLERVAAGLNLRDGAFAVRPLSFGLAGGEVAFSMSFDPAPLPPRLALDIDLRQVDLAKLVKEMPLPDYVKETRGSLGGYAHLRSAGTSLRDVFGSLNGEAGLFAENARFSQLLEVFDRGMLQALGLYASDDQPVPVNCVVTLFDIKDGVATAALRLDGADTTLVGNGTVNFAAETVYVDITPHHKRVTPLTRRTPAELRGTFAHPTLGLGAASMADRTGGGIGLDKVTPPAATPSLIDLGLSDNNACAPRQKPETAATGSSQPPRKTGIKGH